MVGIDRAGERLEFAVSSLLRDYMKGSESS
jgi:hypothetical protein